MGVFRLTALFLSNAVSTTEGGKIPSPDKTPRNLKINKPKGQRSAPPEKIFPSADKPAVSGEGIIRVTTFGPMKANPLLKSAEGKIFSAEGDLRSGGGIIRVTTFGPSAEKFFLQILSL